MYWVNYTTAVRVFRTHAVRCVHCGERYLYDIHAQGRGTASTSGGFIRNLSRAEAEETAWEKAHADAEEQLADSADAVPCPTCGSYQPDMVTLLRKRRHRCLFTLGGVVLLSSLGLIGLGAMVQQQQEFLLTCGGIGSIAGAALLALRWLLVRSHDPNAEDPTARTLLSRSRAYRPEDAAQIEQQRQSQAAVDKQIFEAENRFEQRRASGFLAWSPCWRA
jgi:hypothetical protein